MLISLDEDLHTKNEVIALGIQHGDIIYVDPRFQYTEKGFIKSRFLDDKAAVASIFRMLKYMTEQHLLQRFPHPV